MGESDAPTGVSRGGSLWSRLLGGSRRKREEESHEAEALPSCIALAPDPFVHLAGDRVLAHSQALPSLLGLPARDYRGQSLATLIPRPNHRRLAEILGGPTATQWQLFPYSRNDGTHRLLEWRPLISPESTTGIWWVIRDVTGRQRLEQAVTRARDTEQAKVARDLHDGLGQKLTGLSFQLYALQGRLAKAGHPEASALDPLVALTNEVSREARDLAHSLAPVEISPEGLPLALHHLANTTQQLFGIQCHFESRIGEGATLLAAAANPLYRIAQEALTNAHRHGKASEVRLTLTEHERLWTLRVADNGKGLTQAEPSSGMGIQIMRYRAESVGGRLILEPHGALGGLEVRVELFQRQAPGAVRPTPTLKGDVAPLPATPSNTARVLVVDDHPVTRAGLVQLLSQTPGFTLCGEGNSAQAALELCATLRPDLLITDMLLGDGSALDYVRQVRRVFPGLTIVVLSLYPAERYEKPAREAGADLYLSKQSSPEHLLASLAALMNEE